MVMKGIFLFLTSFCFCSFSSVLSSLNIGLAVELTQWIPLKLEEPASKESNGHC